MKALVISGGGARGAWGGGTIQALSEKYKKDWDLCVGTSTGSLLGPLTLLKEFNTLKKGYTSVEQKDIFKCNPFTVDGKINFMNAIWRIIRKKNSLGDSSYLRDKTIPKFVKSFDYNQLKSNDKEVVSCVVNMSTAETEYHSSKDNVYEKYMDWMHASAAAPVFMSLVNINSNNYTDGGVKDHTPIQYAIDRGATEIDVIVHKSENDVLPQWAPKSVLDSILRVMDILSQDVYQNDIEIAKLLAADKEVKLNFYYMNKKFIKNTLMFEKKIMNEMWKYGYDGIMKYEAEITESYLLTKDGLMRA